jgi:hypothetical protein
MGAFERFSIRDGVGSLKCLIALFQALMAPRNKHVMLVFFFAIRQ